MNLLSKRELLLILISDFSWKSVCVLNCPIIYKASTQNVSTTAASTDENPQ